MARQQKPERPEGVPPDARWVAKELHWEQGTGKGKTRNGPFKTWRADGTLLMECILQAGALHGPYKRWHQSGELAQEGTYVEGAWHGRRVFYGSDKPTTELRAEPALAQAVWKSELDYELGQQVSARHFDRAGNRINADGSSMPARPASVGEKAEYRFEDKSWVEVPLDKDGKRHGRLKSWTHEGKRLEEADWEHGQRHGTSKRFAGLGTVKEEGRFRKGERTGVFRFYSDDGRVESEREYHGGGQTGHAEEYDDAGQLELEETFVRGQRDGVFRLKTSFWNPRVAEVQGSWRKGLPESPWTLMDHAGVPLEMLEMSTDDGALGAAPVFTDQAQNEAAWQTQARAFEEHGQRNLALVAWARAAAAGARVELLFSALGRLAIPVTGPRSEKLLREAMAEGTAEALLTGLRIGASAPRVFEELAVRLDRVWRSRAALDLINAAILLAPHEVDLCFTRVQVLIPLGLAEAAERDAQSLASADPERSEFLLDLGRVVFRELGFWPGAERLTVQPAPVTPVRSAEEVGDAVRVLASRLHRTRQGMLERVQPSAKWLVPPLEAVLPDGPVELKVSKARGKNKAIDQTRGLAHAPEVPLLLRAARNDWAALTWLCWAVGHDAVGIPGEVVTRPELGAALQMIEQRLERCRQRLTGQKPSGPRAEWEGLDLETLHPALLPMAEGELEEVHAVMVWLTDDEALTPWHEAPKARS